MANLHGHEAGNGGHSQGEPTGTAPVLDPTEGGEGPWLTIPQSVLMRGDEGRCARATTSSSPAKAAVAGGLRSFTCGSRVVET